MSFSHNVLPTLSTNKIPNHLYLSMYDSRNNMLSRYFHCVYIPYTFLVWSVENRICYANLHFPSSL